MINIGKELRTGSATRCFVRRQCLIAALSMAVMSARPRVGSAMEGGVQMPARPLIVSANVDPTTGYTSVLNEITGANRFYSNGFVGFNTFIANVEAGYVWNGH